MTTQQKTPGTGGNQSEGLLQHITPTQHKVLTPRLKRLVRALLGARNGLPREAADRVTPCSNSPEYVRQLRERLSLDIPCELVSFINIDGETGKRGIYHLSHIDRDRLSHALRGDL
jgi:hypothetical protein